jgi:hypothetical protein
VQIRETLSASKARSRRIDPSAPVFVDWSHNVRARFIIAPPESKSIEPARRRRRLFARIKRLTQCTRAA